jgi:hypothetical protein
MTVDWVWLAVVGLDDEVPVNPAGVAYLLPGQRQEGGRDVTRVVFGQMIGSLAELVVYGTVKATAEALATGPFYGR